MSAPFGSILRWFAAFLWPLAEADGFGQYPLGITEKGGPSTDPFG